MWMNVGMPGGRQKGSPKGGIGQLLSSLDLTSAAAEKTKKPGYLSSDGTIVRTDTFSKSKSDNQAEKIKQKLIKATLGSQWRSSAVRTHMRLARASTQQECKRVASSANSQASQLKRALSGDCENETEVRAVLAQMQKAAMRAKLKVRQLGEEQDMERQSKRAEEQQRRVRALYLAQERQKKAVARVVRESGYVRESVLAQYQAAEQVRQQLASQLQAPAVSESTGASAVGGAVSAVTPVVAAPAAAAPAIIAASAPVL